MSSGQSIVCIKDDIEQSADQATWGHGGGGLIKYLKIARSEEQRR
jgi:hypothetical protein